jgi:YhcH/YjgK/YiaL family protein
MILDLLSNWTQYEWPSPSFVKAFEFLAAMGPDLADGKHVIDGEDVFCLMQTYDTLPLEGHEFEAHRAYADIQYLMAGQESIYWAPTSHLTVTKPYTPDIEFYSLAPDPTELVLAPGQFCVLFPQDAHAPCILHAEPCTVRKAVIKVRLS